MKRDSTYRTWILSAALGLAVIGCGGGSEDEGGGAAESLPPPAASPTGSSSGGRLDNLLFLHHSVGDGLVTQGDMRGRIAAYNAAKHAVVGLVKGLAADLASG